VTTPYYQDDLVTIYHGDCREWMPDADVIVTDPPYGMSYVHGGYGGGKSYGFEKIAIQGDDEEFDPALLLALNKPTVMFGANHYSERLPSSRGWIVWDKRAGRGSTDQSDAELAWTNVLTVVRVKQIYWGGAIRTGREQIEGRVHVMQKPVALMAWILSMMPDGVVLDPFMGSGSTLVAAKEMGRKSIGIEIDEQYCEVAATRLRQEVLGL
jgi:DNA modification methylase